MLRIALPLRFQVRLPVGISRHLIDLTFWLAAARQGPLDLRLAPVARTCFDTYSYMHGHIIHPYSSKIGVKWLPGLYYSSIQSPTTCIFH